MSTPSLSRQIGAIEALIAIMNNSKPRPKPEQMRMLLADVMAALTSLHTLQNSVKPENSVK